MSDLKTYTYLKEHQNANDDKSIFEMLYDKHAPKAYGFILKHVDSKQVAEEFMMNVFLKVWADIKNFDKDPERKIQRIVLSECRPLYKNHTG